MTNGPLTLRQVGEAAWGTHWQGEMGQALTVSDRTMRYWAGDEGAHAIPPGVEDELITALQQKTREIERIVGLLGTVGIDRTPVQGGDGFQTQVYSEPRRPGDRRKR